MASKLFVQTQEEYDSWLQSMVASKPNEDQTIAATPESDPNAAYLAPFSQQLGIDGSVLDQLHPHQHATRSLTPAA
jgi:cytochrome c oxidase subunit 2